MTRHTVTFVAQYIEEQRAKYSPLSVPLAASQKAGLRNFFSDLLLDETRIVVLDGERVTEPGFYPTLREIGFENLPDILNMAAITLSDVVVSHTPFTTGLLFHELAHVEQYRQLGIARFADLYIRGFLSGGIRHDTVGPMRVCAR